MAVVKKKKAGGAGAANMGGLGITGDINPSILQQVQQSLQGIQNNPTGGYTGGTTPPYQQPPQQWGGPITTGPGPMYPILGPGMKGLPPGGGYGGGGYYGQPLPGQFGQSPPPVGQPVQPQGPQMDWGGLMGKLQGILSPFLGGGGTGPGTGGAPVGGGTQNPMQSVMGALMGSLGGFLNQMPSGAQSGGMDWQNLAKQIQNPTQGAGGTQGQLMNDLMGLMSGFSSGGQQQPPPPTGGQVGNIPQPGQPGFTADDWKYYEMPLAQGGGSGPYSLAGGTPAYSPNPLGGGAAGGMWNPMGGITPQQYRSMMMLG